MLALGLALGAVAYTASQHLMVTFGDGSIDRGAGGPWTRGLYDSSGLPTLPAYLAYFGAVFATVGWWKLCDPLRNSRLKIAPILIAVLAAWTWHLAWPFPQPWGFMVFAGLAITTQLAAPRLSNEARMAAIGRKQDRGA